MNSNKKQKIPIAPVGESGEITEKVQDISHFPIVGIGTSAGGLEALEQFLSHVPSNSGMAFVIIQHLSPLHTGNLPELLQRHTAMRVQQVNGITKVQQNHVYIIAPNKDMTISNRTLHIRKPDMKSRLHLPIDTFLNSLAVDCAEQSIGVILSGMGSDGTLGLRAIKEHAGLTLAQEPASAKFDSMPRSSIDSGVTDIVAPADQLPGLIINHLGIAAGLIRSAHDQKCKEDYAFEKITSLLKINTRHDFSLYKQTSILRRIERRMNIHKILSTTEYADFLQNNPQEVDLLFKELLIGVTSFFRDKAMWDELSSEAMQQILSAYPEGGTLRAWSCACSTGEEAFSLAMVFREALDQTKQPGKYNVQIFATDLDVDAIEKARRGLYSAAIESVVSPERLQRFFKKEGKQYRISSEIREMVTFAQQNVIMDPPFTKLDIIICRNLLIYLTTDIQKRLLFLFHYSLKPGGLLFLGSAETVGTLTDMFIATNLKSKLFWRSKSILQNRSMTLQMAFKPNTLASFHQEPIMLKSAYNLQQLADNLILKHFSAPTVLVNNQGDIAYISGHTGKYLEPAAGKANLNIFAMAREGLQYKLCNAFSQILTQQEPVTFRTEITGTDNNIQIVETTLLAINAPEALQGMILISFKDIPQLPKAKQRRSAKLPESKQVEELQQELFNTREELRSTREEMQSAHEELQSTNEELQSTNEELTTSKEEMQSMNEELQSVNAEQFSRLNDFMQINNDMENLLNSTEIVTVFLDNHLKVRRFTTGANKIFKLIPSDVGRPLTDIVSNLDYPQLYDHVQDVLRKLISMETRVVSRYGRWFLVRIMPYRTLDKMIDGVVITLNDITCAKTMEDKLLSEIASLKK